VRTEFPRIWSASTVVSAWGAGLLSAYFAISMAICLIRHLDWPAVAFTGASAVAFAVTAAIHIRNHMEQRRAGAQSE
jgi:hypothetical protein